MTRRERRILPERIPSAEFGAAQSSSTPPPLPATAAPRILAPAHAALQVAAVIALGAALATCQSDLLGGKAGEPVSPARLEYLTEFKKIDVAGKGRISMEQATAYYNNR